MKKYVITLVCALLLVIACSAVFAEEKSVSLPTGTAVQLQVLGDIVPASYKVGDPVSMVVAYDVIVDKNVLIKAGTPVKGIIKTKVSRCIFGLPGKISISAENVTAVDGQVVQLTGSKLFSGTCRWGWDIAGLFIWPCFLVVGGNPQIPNGTSILSTTAAPVTIAVQ